MRDYGKMTFSGLYGYLESNRDNLSHDDIFKIEMRMDEIMQKERREKVETKVWSKTLENKFDALFGRICKEYGIENYYGRDFREELRSVIRGAAENYYLYESNLNS